MQSYLRTDPLYKDKFKAVWLWSEFPGRKDSGSGQDTGIDLVALTHEGDYWAIQCKCYQESAVIDKPSVDSFLSTSSKTFKNEQLQTTHFAQRLWISTTNRWGANATDAIKNQSPAVARINLSDLQAASVDWGALEEGVHGDAARAPKKEIYKHVWEVRDATHEYFKTGERGKLIMACGTGKTLTSLKIAEQETGGAGTILFLVPSIALLGQTLREWSNEADEPIQAVCICSDPEVSKKKSKSEEGDAFSVIDLALPASTNPQAILHQFQHIKKNARPGMTVVFSTYQSIDVIARAQKELLKEGFAEFDLIICDEAHRTTGVSLAGEDESAFTKVHNNDFIKAKKRLYMTATPRLYNDDVKSRAAQAEAILCSMDDPKLYGEEIFRIGFGEAVERKLLSDYKVLVLTLSEENVPPALQKALAKDNHEINTDDLSKLIGCINGLSKQILGDEGLLTASDPDPMRRAVAFCQRITDSKKISTIFNASSDVYLESLPPANREKTVCVESQHIDGTMSAPARDELLGWLKDDPGEDKCRILTNVRCLSEGVDVPSLDAVLFLSARNSQVDVVQSVGRVMRRAPGKKFGYIIIPVVVPSNVEPEQALNDNERYKVVWTVLNALRAHDDRFNAIVNKLDLNKQKPSQILVGKPDVAFDSDGKAVQVKETGNGESSAFAKQLALQFEELQGLIFARMVKKVGDRLYWEQWAKDVAIIAQRQIETINHLLKVNTKHEKTFNQFLNGLRKNINPSVTQEEAVEMLAQHMITRPVFEALFEGGSFVSQNIISKSMQKMLDLLDKHSLEKDSETLQKFYESVKKRAQDIDNAEARQRIIIELYDTFFRTAFPKLVEKLGIVYTPVEVVDFILHSVNDVLKKEFGRALTDENVHILDPFTGTGTFLTRLLQSGLIEDKDLERKYRHELHANEIVLLAYYIAAVNIENVFHDRASASAVDGELAHLPFEGILLTDTFQLNENDAAPTQTSSMFPENTERVQKQKDTPIRVIMTNPPYSVGQNSANDNAQNQKYDALDARIAATYAKGTSATNKNSLYDSYIKAFRWSADRLDFENGGVIAFVTNGSWLDGNAHDGFRRCLENEFSSIWVFNLRGNQRTSGELSRKEGGKIFGSGSRTPIAITLLVKNPQSQTEKATIHYHDIGDYLKREDKLQIVGEFGSVGNAKMPWQILAPNASGDWISHRSDAFGSFFPIGDKDDKKANAFFNPFYSRGVASARDAYCYNSNRNVVEENISELVEFYNEQRIGYHEQRKAEPKLEVENYINFDSNKITWNRGLKNDLRNNRPIVFDDSRIVTSLYRPFIKQHFYFARELNDMVYQVPKLFPTSKHKNLVICVSAGGSKELSPLIADCIPDLHFNGDTQCFPLYYYEERDRDNISLFDNDKKEWVRRDGISDFILERARVIYGPRVTKEEIFYYVYGLLHSEEYRTLFAADLKKMLPRLPLLETPADFWAFSKAGRALAELHLNYETVPAYEGVKVTGNTSSHLRVEKMRFPKKGEKGNIIYNSQITISDIPEKAYEYVVNGKSAIEWIMERYQVKTDKDSGIKNDPNDWAIESGNPRYILDLLLSVINLSVQTVNIVHNLPKVTFS